MGIQNAIITKISNASIRTTHVTGTVTDIGIEMGKMLYWNGSAVDTENNFVKSNRAKLYLLVALLMMFFIGGVLGAFGFKKLGFSVTFPLALWLIVSAI